MTTATTLVDRLFEAYAAGQPLPLIAGGEPKAGETPPPAGTTTEAAPDLGKLVEAALAKHGDQTSALKAVISDLYAARDDNKALKAKLPADGALVLTGDDAKEWGTYRTLGKPGDLKKALDEGSTFKETATKYEREKHHAVVAGLVGFKPTVLDDLATAKKVTIVVKDEKDKAGKEIKVPHVQLEGDKTTPLTAYAEASWKDYLPALKGTENQQTKPAPNGTPQHSRFQPAPKPAIAPENQQKRRQNAF